MEQSTGTKKDHFQGKTALRHIAEVRSRGISASREIHGAEAPGPVFAFLDAARESAILIAVFLVVSSGVKLSADHGVALGLSFLLGWGFWKGARSAFLAWSRLQRMHRVVVEEKEEIESNRPQEREELEALYGEKGFSGPLLEKVVDVLMADQDRLLRVMLQEEMGFRLEEHQHPLVQGGFAAAGVLCSMILIIPSALGYSPYVMTVCAAAFIALMGGFFAWIENNDPIPAFLWNGMFAAVTLVLVHSCVGIFV